VGPGGEGDWRRKEEGEKRGGGGPLGGERADVFFFHGKAVWMTPKKTGGKDPVGLWGKGGGGGGGGGPVPSKVGSG